MRSILFALSIAVAMPAVSTTAALADGHSCNQLRTSVRNTVPLTIRNLPYALLNCGAIGEIHLLSTNRSYSASYLEGRIEAIFRREGIVL